MLSTEKGPNRPVHSLWSLWRDRGFSGIGIHNYQIRFFQKVFSIPLPPGARKKRIDHKQAKVRWEIMSDGISFHQKQGMILKIPYRQILKHVCIALYSSYTPECL